MTKFAVTSLLLATLVSCNLKDHSTTDKVRLVTLDPGHFHAALVQKEMYDGVDTNVVVYAPEGNDLTLHLARIDAYNTRPASPTHWSQTVYAGPDFFEKMLAEKKGNVVVISGNNQKKTSYILQSLQNGFHVFADKPMAIDSEGFNQLQHAFETAAHKDLQLYDIMTERFEITTLLQRELSRQPALFGSLEKGSPENPAITKESVHHFYKQVSGKVLTRPAWFMDVAQQGEGIVDVMTHLVDLVQWAAFPEQVIDYPKDISINAARRWPTRMTAQQFTEITRQPKFPSYLSTSITNDSALNVFCNGEISYTIKGVHAKTAVTWNYKAPEGSGDTHASIMRGTRANLLIRQGKAENFEPTLYIEPVDSLPADSSAAVFATIRSAFPGVEFIVIPTGWKVNIPAKYKEGHEAHFARVTSQFLGYLKNRNMPAWEVPNMLSKYYTTTTALQMSKKNNP